jgi:hypothetical protein
VADRNRRERVREIVHEKDRARNEAGR